MAGSDVNRANQLIPPEDPPETRFTQPGNSGLYAAMHGPGFRWASPSAYGREMPFDETLAPGEVRFDGPLESDAGDLYRLGMGVAWEVAPDEAVYFTLFVAESADVLRQEIAVFRRSLWVYLGGAGFFMLALQSFMVRWSLQPLRKVVEDLSRVERGESERLEGDYPREVSILTDNLNGFIESEREHLSRYRNTLGDLAHSLKTPLAVLRTRMEAGDGDLHSLRSDLTTQLARMDEIVAYQLSRAATSGHQRFAAPLEIDARAEELASGLEKVYASKGVYCEFDLDSAARFHGEQGDLMELLGNLVENAFKWAKRRVLLTTRSLPAPAGRRTGIMMAIEDDGPGIPPEQVERLLQRGVRGDERVQGHGIGLAIVQDIVRSYRGQLKVMKSEELGGARFEVVIPPAI